MSDAGFGQFHVYYKTALGKEVRKAYRTFDEADKAREFLQGLGIDPEIEMNSKKYEWMPPGNE